MIRQEFCILYLRRFYKFPIDHYMQVSIELFFNGVNNFWVPVTDIGHTDSADEVNKFFSVYIKKRTAFGFAISKASGVGDVCAMCFKKSSR